MKRVIISSVLVALLCATAALAAERMRIAYSSISGAYVGIWVAHDAGLFAKEGLDNQMILIPSATQLAQVAVAGDVDIASLGGGPMIAATLSGADLKVIGNNVNKMIFSIHAKPEVKSIEELRGKRIGVSRFGSSSDVSARYALRKFNLDPQKDVILLQLGSMSSIFGALRSGAVDGALVSPPTQFLSEKLGFKELVSITEMISHIPIQQWPYRVTSSERGRICSTASYVPMCAACIAREQTGNSPSSRSRNIPP